MPAPFLLLAFTVGNNPNSVSSVQGVDGTSRNNKRLAGVADAFQVRKHRVEFHADDSSNVFANNPRGPNFPYNSQHFMPDRTVIIFASALPGDAKRLARESAGNNVNGSGELAAVKVFDV